LKSLNGWGIAVQKLGLERLQPHWKSGSLEPGTLSVPYLSLTSTFISIEVSPLFDGERRCRKTCQ
jgi:hypothetical protein